MSEAGLAVVSRPTFFDESTRSEELRLSDSYRGFEGQLWTPEFAEGGALAPLASAGRLWQFLRTIRETERARLLYLRESESGAAPAADGFDFERLGIDVGIMRGEFDKFSVLYHEVLFGRLLELRQFRARLNAGRLMESMADARDLLQIHAELAAKNADVERFDDPRYPVAYEIFQVRSVWKEE